MRILEKGRTQTGWAMEYLCTGAGNGLGGCGSKLLVEQDDLFRTTSSCMGEVDIHYTFKCTICGVLTDMIGRITFPDGVPLYKEWIVRHTPPPARMRILHIHGQIMPHDPVLISGSPEALEDLARVLYKVVSTGSEQSVEMYVVDGEAYDVTVRRNPSNRNDWNPEELPYSHEMFYYKDKVLR